MERSKIILTLSLLVVVVSTTSFADPITTTVTTTTTTSSVNGEVPKPSFARTMLKVSRSLPGETEELKIRTNEGSLATLIVKRREKSISPSSMQNPVASIHQSKSEDASLSTTIGYQNVEVDPWNRLKTWSSVSNNGKGADQRRQQLQKIEEDDVRNWVPLSRGFDSWRPVSEPLYSSQQQPSKRSWLVADQLENVRGFQTIPADPHSNENIMRYTDLNQPQRSTGRTNVGANLMKNQDDKDVPNEVTIQSEINVKPQPGSIGIGEPAQPKRSAITMGADGTLTVYGRRVPDDPIDRINVWRNARVINDQLVTDPDTAASTSARMLAEPETSFDSFFENVNRRYSKLSDDGNIGGSSHKSKNYRNEDLAAEVYESAEDTYRPSIRKRMLQPEITANYPNSRLYSPPDTTKSSITGVVKPGTRAPVLQYAHPELGVQPAKAIPKSESPKTLRKHEEMRTEAPIMQQYNPPASSNGEQRQQKRRYVLNEKNIIDSYNYKNYYPHNPHYYGLKRPVVEPPLWVKISEGIKNQFSDSVAKVSQLTKPVFDPLAEATRKISENLGLSRSQDPAQDKVGSVATGSSILIPALGLMASGAALGIGAVAVGRYLDVDVLKRSNNAAHFAMAAEVDGERALEAIDETKTAYRLEAQPGVNQIYLLVEDNDESEGMSRRKRSSEVTNVDYRQIQRKGADPINELVEIDKKTGPLDENTADEGNNIHLDDSDVIAKTIFQRTLEAISNKAEKDKTRNQMAKELSMARQKRSLSDDELDEALQNLETAEVAEATHVTGDWSNTPCAKKLFCDAMVKRGSDSYIFMDKKMYGLLRMIQPSAAEQVSAHFDEVMEAVRRHDCSVFSCPRARMPRNAMTGAPSA